MNELYERADKQTPDFAETYNETIFDLEIYLEHSEQLLNQIPIKEIFQEFNNIVKTYDFSSHDLLSNIGFRIKLNDNNDYQFEEWSNVINSKDRSIHFSIHKSFSKKKYELGISGKKFSNQIEIGFDGTKEQNSPIENNMGDNYGESPDNDGSSVITAETYAESLIDDNRPNNGKGKEGYEDTTQQSGNNSTRIVRNNRNNTQVINVTQEEECSSSIRLIRSANCISTKYNVVRAKNNDSISSTITKSNDWEETNETTREEIAYSISEPNSTEKDEKNPNTITSSDPYDNNITSNMVIHRVTTETTKSEANNHYFETNYETYTIERNSKYGKKRYQNNKGRKFVEDWHRINLDKGGYDSKIKRFLDDGCGKTTTETIGVRYEGDVLDHDYHDTYVNDLSTGNELTTKIGRDRINEWNSTNRRNKRTGMNHVENKARNFAEG